MGVFLISIFLQGKNLHPYNVAALPNRMNISERHMGKVVERKGYHSTRTRKEPTLREAEVPLP